jgi:hypothetical protein
MYMLAILFLEVQSSISSQSPLILLCKEEKTGGKESFVFPGLRRVAQISEQMLLIVPGALISPPWQLIRSQVIS